MKKALIVLSISLLAVCAFTPLQSRNKPEERVFVVRIPEHLAFSVYHLLVGDAEQQLSVAKYKQEMPEILKDIVPQIVAQANKYAQEDSAKEVKADSIHRKNIKDTSHKK